MVPLKPATQQSGQALTEYVLLLLLVSLAYALISHRFRSLNIADRLLDPIRNTYAYTYRYGHPKARGPEDGGPRLHPRAIGGENFRLFINPDQSR